jgi:ATP-dependent protease HslVU (ClpYQ) peptidase subunit
MTLITGLRCSDAVVLGSDSQLTVDGGLKATVPKLFVSPHQIVWGVAGPVAAAQAIEARFKQLILDPDPNRDDGRKGIHDVMLAAAKDMKGSDGHLAGGPFRGLFAWYSKEESQHHLLLARSDGVVELQAQRYSAVGSPSSKELAQFAFFGFSRSGFLEYETLPLEAAKMLVHMVTDDAVQASAQGVDGPIQLAVVTTAGARVLEAGDLNPVQDTAAAFKMHQADFLKRTDRQPEETAASGLVPGVDGS